MSFIRFPRSGNPQQHRTRCCAVMVCLMGALVAGATATAQPDEEVDAKLQEMRERAQSLKAVAVSEGQRSSLKLIKRPLLRYNDPARDTTDGTLWAWDRTGRPAALIALFSEPLDGGEKWSYEFVSLSSNRIAIRHKSGWQWSPKEANLQMQPVPQGFSPADTEAIRLVQMKGLARRFTALEFFLNERYQLRLLPRPLHRYSNPQIGLIDGGFFVFSYGTNPEVGLLLECRREGSGGLRWEYGLCRLGAARLEVQLDEQTVWKQPGVADATADDPYFIQFVEE